MYAPVALHFTASNKEKRTQTMMLMSCHVEIIIFPAPCCSFVGCCVVHILYVRINTDFEI